MTIDKWSNGGRIPSLRKSKLSMEEVSVQSGVSRQGSTGPKQRRSIPQLVCKDLWDYDIGVISSALRDLGDLCADDVQQKESNRTEIIRAGGHLAIVKAMEKNVGDVAVQSQGNRALQHLAADDDTKSLIAYAGGIEAITAAMKQFPDKSDVQQHGCAALQKLASGTEERKRIVEADGIVVIVSAMKASPGERGIQKSACGALMNLAEESEATKNFVIDLGGLEAIARTIRNHRADDQVRKSARRAMEVLM